MNMRTAVTLLSFAVVCSQLQSAVNMHPGTNGLKFLLKQGLVKQYEQIKLHLGCGQTHLKGYINIDFSPESHTVQTSSGADVYADITKLYFPQNSLTEVRSHHVFEHFTRPTALGFLCLWHYWLQKDGILTIETPDMQACMDIIVNSNHTYRQKQVTMRHAFGSHEADWALHCDGWYKEKFEHVLHTLGYEVASIEKSGSPLIPNITVKAKKRASMSYQHLVQKAKELLRESMVDASRSEECLWKVWCTDLDLFIKQMSLPGKPQDSRPTRGE